MLLYRKIIETLENRNRIFRVFSIIIYALLKWNFVFKNEVCLATF